MPLARSSMATTNSGKVLIMEWRCNRLMFAIMRRFTNLPLTELWRRAVETRDDLVDFAQLRKIVKHLLQLSIQNRLQVSFGCRSKIP